MSGTLSSNSGIPNSPRNELLTEKVAIDCEMMRSNIGQVLGRVSVINYEGKTIYDTFVYYPPVILITNTDEQFSGINEDCIDPRNGAQLFTDVQAHLAELFRDRIVIGHDIEKDLRVISMDLSPHLRRIQGGGAFLGPFTFSIKTRDTQKYTGYRKYANPGANQGPSLKNLAVAVLGRPIKQGRVSSVEDAVATMEVYRKAEAAIDAEQGR